MWKLLAKQIVQFRCAHNYVDASETAITAQRQERQCRPPASSICFCVCFCFFFKKNFLLSPVASVLLVLCFCFCFCASAHAAVAAAAVCLSSASFHVCSLPFMCALSLLWVSLLSCGLTSPFSCTLGVWRKDNMRKKCVIEQLKRRTTQPQLSRRRRRTLGEESRKTKTIFEDLCL